MNSTVLTGKVKFYNSVKGYGFIVENEGGKERFFHITGVPTRETFKQDDIVTYSIFEDDRGIRAVDVKKQ